MFNITKFEELSFPQLWLINMMSKEQNDVVYEPMIKRLAELMFVLENSCISDFYEKVLQSCDDLDLDVNTKAKEVYGDKYGEICEEILAMANVFAQLLIAAEFIDETCPEFGFQNYVNFFSAAIELNSESDFECSDECTEECKEECSNQDVAQ